MVEPKRPYSEEEALSQHLWHNYAGLFPIPQRQAMKALIGDDKAGAAETAALASRIRTTFGSVEGKVVAEQLADGRAEFQRRACAQLLAERGG